MDNTTYNLLMELIKVFKKNKVVFPGMGKQNFHDIHSKEDENEEFELLINQKGHKREDVLTYQMKSKRNGLLVRLDMTGPPHDDGRGGMIETPHLHIFNDTYSYGRVAISVDEISRTSIIEDLNESLLLFLQYNKVNMDDIQLPWI